MSQTSKVVVGRWHPYYQEISYHYEDKDAVAIELTDRLHDLKAAYEVQGWSGITVSSALANLMEMVEATELVLVRVGEDGLVAFSMGTPWFSTEVILTEEFIVGCSIDDAVPLLKVAAKAEGISRIVVGTRAAPNGRHLGLAKRYEQVGLSVSTIELTTEV